jgi:hypothetical protein
MGIKSGFISAIKVIECLNFLIIFDLFEFDSNDITENLIESRNELMNAYEGLFLSELYNPENDG